MSLIQVSNLTFSYDGSYDNIFENVTFQIDSDWKLGFIGRNGRGKTTFLNLLLGKYEYQGTITTNMQFEYFPYEVKDPSELTIDVVSSINHDFEEWQLYRELSLLDVSDDVLYRPFETLSNGEQTKVLLATLFLKDNSFLLIDEPTNHLDSKARQIISNYLKSKRSFILVSHDRNFLDNCVDHILSINKTNIEVQKGNFSSWWANKQMLDQYEIEENERLHKDIKRLTTAAKRAAEWSHKVEATKIGQHAFDRGAIGHKAAKMMKRSKAIELRQTQAIEEKSKLLKNIEKTEDLKLSPLKFYTDPLVTLEDVSIYYGEKQACSHVSFSIHQGDRIALCGKNGCGKSSILKLICGQEITYTGTIHKSNRLIISYVSQDTSQLQGTLTEFAALHNIDESLFKTILRKLDFSRAMFDKKIESYSGGQKKKVLIAKSLCEQAHLYIWDEPLNFIDIYSRMQIEELLLQYQPTILFVEHDTAFCEKLTTKQIQLS